MQRDKWMDSVAVVVVLASRHCTWFCEFERRTMLWNIYFKICDFWWTHYHIQAFVKDSVCSDVIFGGQNSCETGFLIFHYLIKSFRLLFILWQCYITWSVDTISTTSTNHHQCIFLNLSVTGVPRAATDRLYYEI